MNKLIKTISRNKIGYEFLRSLNGLLGLTDRELELLSVFLDVHLEGTYKNKNNNSIDSPETRRMVINNLGITKDNLSRYIKMFRDKGIFIRQSKTTKINNALIPIIIGGKVVQITMILKINDNEDL